MSVTNNAILIGRLGKDPEVGTTKNNQPKVSFSMGVGRLGAAKDTTDWFFVTMYGKQARPLRTCFARVHSWQWKEASRPGRSRMAAQDSGSPARAGKSLNHARAAAEPVTMMPSTGRT